MVVRDHRRAGDLGARTSCSVYLSVPTVDEDAWRRLEPGTAHPLQRLRAVRALVDAGIHAGVLMAPIVPGVVTTGIARGTLKAIADSRRASVGAMVMHLEGGTREHFMRVLAREFPSWRPVRAALRGKYAPPCYAERVQHMVGLLKAQYGLPDVTRRRGSPMQQPRDERGAAGKDASSTCSCSA